MKYLPFILDGLLFATLLFLAVFGLLSSMKAKDAWATAAMAVLIVTVIGQAAQIHKLTAALKSSQSVARQALEIAKKEQSNE